LGLLIVSVNWTREREREREGGREGEREGGREREREREIFSDGRIDV
jgi:hypothetical protein